MRRIFSKIHYPWVVEGGHRKFAIFGTRLGLGSVAGVGLLMNLALLGSLARSTTKIHYDVRQNGLDVAYVPLGDHVSSPANCITRFASCSCP